MRSFRNTVEWPRYDHRRQMDDLVEKRKKGDRIVVFASGISGTGAKEYLALQQELALENAGNGARSFELIDVAAGLWDYYRDCRQIVDPVSILHTGERELSDKVANTYKEVNTLIRDNPDKDFVIIGHATFLWDHQWVRGLHSQTVTNLKPDLFVNIIDNEAAIVNILANERYAAQWDTQQLSIEDIIGWMSNEHMITRTFADITDKPLFTITRRMSPNGLYMLMQHPEKKSAYFMQQMTHALTDGTYSRADKLFMQLVLRFFTSNPRGYEVTASGEHSTAMFTKRRDINYFAAEAELGIAYYNQPTPSEGVAVESSTIFNSSKPVYRIWPRSYSSPFLQAHSTAVFRTAKQLLARMDEVYGPPVKMILPRRFWDDAQAFTVQLPKNYHDGSGTPRRGRKS